MDVVTATPMALTNKNLYAYCDNNPINRIDATGQLWSSIFEFTKTVVTEIGRTIGGLAPAYAGCSGLAIADGPLPIGDAAAVTGIMLLTVGSIGYGIYQAVEYSSVTKTKSKAKEEAVAITKSQNYCPTLIYRYDFTGPEKLVPTIENLNATGVVYAVQDGVKHVSVYPIGGTIEQWYNQGAESVWTEAIMASGII